MPRKAKNRTRKKRGSGLTVNMAAKYLEWILKPGTSVPKTRQLMIDTIIYSMLMKDKYIASLEKGITAESKIPLPAFNTESVYKVVEKQQQQVGLGKRTRKRKRTRRRRRK